MAKPLDVIQGRISDSSRLTSFGDIESMKRVQFFVGDHGPFYEEFTLAEFIPENVLARQNKIRDTIRVLYQT